MKILITGIAGFIGSHLAERLMASGHEVGGLDCLTDFYARALKESNVNVLQSKGITVSRLDLATAELSAAVQNVEIVYHAAAQPGISPTATFRTYTRNNFTATYRLIEAVQHVPTFKGFVNLSTSSVYGRMATGAETTEPQPTSYYGVTKLAGEQLVLAAARERQFPACSLRLFSVYGPRERPDKVYPKLIRCILEDRPFPLYEGSAEHRRSYTYIDDIVDGLAAVLPNFDRCVGEIFNIGTDATITTGEGIAMVEAIIGKKAIIDRKPKRAGDQLKTHANIAKARRILGYNPTTLPQTGLAKEVAWYREEIFGKITLWQD